MDQITEFWALVEQVWREGFLGVDIGRALVALGILFAFLVLRGLLSRFILTFVTAWVTRTKNKIDDTILEAVEAPIRFIPVALGIFFAAEYLELEGAFDDIASNLIRSLIAYIIFWAVFRCVDPLSFLLRRFNRIFTEDLIDWTVKAIRFMVFFLGLATILEIWGIQVGPILAGMGLFGVAVALGAQDLFKNLIAGILIIAEKRFRKGDWVFVSGIVEGTVEQIGFRSTVVRRFDKAPVYVPNARLSDNAVTNFSSMTHRRIKWLIGVEYSSTIEQLRSIRDQIEQYIHENDAFASPDDVSTFVRIDRFSDSSIDILLYCFTKTTVWGEWLAIKEELACKVKEIVESAGTGFAFPSRSLYLERLPDDAPEVFVPPRSQTKDAPV